MIVLGGLLREASMGISLPPDPFRRTLSFVLSLDVFKKIISLFESLKDEMKAFHENKTISKGFE